MHVQTARCGRREITSHEAEAHDARWPDGCPPGCECEGLCWGAGCDECAASASRDGEGLDG